MREIVLDTETTGMDPADGDRMVEIGCVELLDHMPTGRNLHIYLNPERDVPAEAFAVHGLSEEFLKKHPTFAEVVDKFVEFIGQDTLVIHNAEFDMKFINAELKTLGFPKVPNKQVIDTLAMARQKFPGSPASLDALCRRFNVDTSARTLHGALLDSELLAEVYLELLGGRQHGLSLDAREEKSQTDMNDMGAHTSSSKKMREPRSYAPLPEEVSLHEEMLGKLKNPLWKKAG